MLSFDLSKAVPSKAFYLLAFIPGLFFEVSILLGSPERLTALASKVQALSLNRYAELAIALFLAFVIGNAFMFLVSPVIQVFVGYCYKFWLSLRPGIDKSLLIPLLNWVLRKPFWSRRVWLIHFQRRVTNEAHRNVVLFGAPLGIIHHSA
jgi:hypothetical protein